MENKGKGLAVPSNINEAHTISAKFYTDPQLYEQAKNSIFLRSWQFITDEERIRIPGQVYPHNLLEGCLDEPILLTRDFEDMSHCLSNVCTHRGFLLVNNGGNMRTLRCRYHGRKFTLDGKFESMPEFENAVNFPSEKDNLPRVMQGKFGPFIFASLSPARSFEDFIKPITDRLDFLPFNEFKFDSARSRDYLVQANWALYCDNYLEGFHIPYVHPGLNSVLKYEDYNTEIFEEANLQLGIAEGAEDTFELPANHIDSDRDVAAYYFWLFPNTMFNFYPWGLSINIVSPLAYNRTKVRFLTYVWKPELLDKGAGSGLDRVEREDEDVVELVQKGVKSRLYDTGRFSPRREKGVHHFHRLLSKYLDS